MERRKLILGSVATLAATATSRRWGSVFGGATAFAASSHGKIIATAGQCLDTGLACITLCRKELAKGNKDMAECLATVYDMVAACESLRKLAANESPHLGAYARVCEKILADCARSCEKHAKHMAECDACMKACKECIEACKAV
jgi:Cys-rich four helix bundle protein (predicted Tat secretion target)